jgi:hypothetical protein
MEPVIVELRLKNGCDLPLELDTELHPEYGNVNIYLRRPDGRTLQYKPVLCKLATVEPRVLKPLAEAVKGEDRHSENILISYGTFGHYFDAPGEYLVRALYQGAGDILITSPIHRFRVGSPISHEEDRIAQDYYTYEAGMALYLSGSDSPHLQGGMNTLQEMADRFKGNPVGAHMALVLAQNLRRPFFRVEEGKLVETRSAEPERALALTEQAMRQDRRDKDTFNNITYHELRRSRADLLAATGETEEAKKELRSLARVLKNRGVNAPVLEDIKSYEKSL